MDDILDEQVDEMPPGVRRNIEIPSETRENLKRLPRFSWAAFLMPVIWGPAHGHWLTIVFYPLWIWVDDCIMVATKNPNVLTVVIAVVVTAGTVAAMALFGATAGPKGYLRVADRVPIDKYLRRERIWLVAGIVFAVAVLTLATLFNIFLYDSLRG